MIHPQEWTGGAAFPSYRIIAISVPLNRLSWGKDTIAHELTHLVVGQIVFNPYNDLPTWLEEGLAMFIEENDDPAIASYMKIAIEENKLITVRSLSSPFSAYSELAAVSYGQSQSLVEFLLNTYGRSKMLELLTTFRDGVDYDEALEKVYGFNMDELDAYWRDSISNPMKMEKAESKEDFTLTGFLQYMNMLYIPFRTIVASIIRG